jgi:hypothetical protein
MADANYKCGSRDYLLRAREQLDQNSPKAMFYAALELRFGIEARLQEYLEVQQHISQKKRQGWKIAELGKSLKHAFDDGDRIVEIRMSDMKSGESAVCYYTPVTATLKKNGQRLGNFLHALKEHKPAGDKWWQDFHDLLNATYQELRFATTGTLLGPPLLSPQNQSRLSHELGYDQINDEMIVKLGGIGRVIQMSINLVKTLPSDKNQT